MAKDLSFFELQTQMIGFDAKKDYAFYSRHPDEPIGGKTSQPLFWEDENGNVCIGVMDIFGNLLTYDAKDSQSRIQIKPICIKRLKKPMGETKYLPEQTGWGSLPYPTKKVIENFNKNKTVRRLFVVEGYKKAFAMYKLLDLDVIGIPGINQWKAKKDDEIYFAIKSVIQKCNVQELIFVTDADTLQVKYEPGKDLYKRPNSFYSAVIKFKELTKDFDINCYLSHIMIEHVNDAKGIDDLIYLHRDNKGIIDKIKDELNNASGTRTYITKFAVSSASHQAIREYFHIKDAYKPQKFYEAYENIIGANRFVYNNSVWQLDIDSNELKCHKDRETAQYLMIKDKYYVKGDKPLGGSVNVIESILEPIGIEGIKIKLGNNKKKLETFKSSIDYYDGALSYPSHVNFEQMFEVTNPLGIKTKWYNIYHRINHVANDGKIDVSMQMIKHIFGTGKVKHRKKLVDKEGRINYEDFEINEWELGLDYIKLLWERPTQILPILVLASSERQTGKTTFWDWMKSIFQKNAVGIKGEDLHDKFTDYFSACLLLMIEEAFIEKAATVEKLKEIVTAKYVKFEQKFGAAMQIESYIKVGISTNRIKDFAKIDIEENRFWVRKINPIKTDIIDFDLLDKLKEEIPAFLNFIQERTFVTSKESRAWFAENLISTPELQEVKKESRWSFEIELEDALKNLISSVKKGVIKLATSDIKELTGNHAQFNLIRKTCQEKLKLKLTPYSVNYTKYKLSYSKNLNGEPEQKIDETKESSTVYTFFANMFFTWNEIIEFMSNAELLDFEENYLKEKNESFFDQLSEQNIVEIARRERTFSEQIKDKEIIAQAEKYKTLIDFITKELNGKTPY